MRRDNYDDNLDWRFNNKYPGYEFSEYGDVKDSDDRPVKPIYEGNKSPKIRLRDRDGVVRKLSLAKVLLETFRGEQGPDYKADFKNGNNRDLRIDNLRWREVINPGSATIREWVPGHPEITLNEYYRNTYVIVLETGETYYNIWAYINATGENEALAKKCVREKYVTNSKGQHVLPYLYDDGYGVTYKWEGYYE